MVAGVAGTGSEVNPTAITKRRTFSTDLPTTKRDPVAGPPIFIFCQDLPLGRRGLDVGNMDGVDRRIERSGHFHFFPDPLFGLVGVVQFVPGAGITL